MLNPLAQPWILATSLGSGQQRQEHPQTTCLRLQTAGTTSLERARLPSNSGYVRAFRRRADCNDTVLLCSATHRCAVSVESTHQCGVNCQLSTTVEKETVHDDFEPPAVHNVWLTQIQVAHEDVRGHPATASRQFARPTLAQHPSLCARCTVMAKFVGWEATQAGTHCQVKRETQTAQKSDTEQLRRNGRDAARGGRSSEPSPD